MAKTATYSLIQSQTLSSSQASVTFSSIPQTFTDLVLVTQHTLVSGSNNQLVYTFNGDTATANYSYTSISGNGTAAQSYREINQSKGYFSYASTNSQITSCIINILDYSNSTTYKTLLSRVDNTTQVEARVNLWRSTAAVTSMTLSIYNSLGTLATGCNFKLYGIEAYK